jgi:Fe-S-cluster containining protein
MPIPKTSDRNISLPQLVPSKRCLSCDVCCRFPEKDSPLAPYFTAEEIIKAVARGVSAERFSNPGGCKIELIPHTQGDGYICPAFDPMTNGCRIYEDRPLDCQLYPLALMWNPSKTTVLLGYDRKCPFIQETLFDDTSSDYARTLASHFESDKMILTLRSHPGLIGAYQEDVMILQPLRRLSEALTAHPIQPPTRPSPEALGLTSLADTDRPLFDSTLRWTKTELSSYSWPAHMIWKDLFKYYWAIIERQFCLFVKYTDGLFMPLPPLGESVTESAVRRCFELMDAFNPNPAVSRIENLDAAQAPFFEAMGFVIKTKEQEYLYDREQLVRLAGDQYKSKRWAYNRFVHERLGQKVRLGPYRSSDLNDCMELYARWKNQHALNDTNTKDRALDQMMLEDAESAHRRALEDFTALDLIGRVIRVDGAIVAYTLGYSFRPDTFCVLLEVTDLEITGLSAYLFREFCRELAGYTTIHAMDDSGLERLRNSKLSYRPSKILTSYIATRHISSP